MLNNETIYELTQGIEFMGYEHMIFYCENVIKTKSERDVYRKAQEPILTVYMIFNQTVQS